jgi:hypothetical protein
LAAASSSSPPPTLRHCVQLDGRRVVRLGGFLGGGEGADEDLSSP